MRIMKHTDLRRQYVLAACFAVLCGILYATTRSVPGGTRAQSAVKNLVGPSAYAGLPLLGISTSCSIDAVDQKALNGDLIAIGPGIKLFHYHGWAVDQQAKLPAKAVVVEIDHRAVALADYGDLRPDVAKYFGVPAYANSGFHGTVDVSGLARGLYELELAVVNNAGTGYYACDNWKLNIR